MATKPAPAAPVKPAAPVVETAAPATAEAAPATVVGAAAVGATKQGAAVVLQDGERRIDYIRRRYGEGAKRGEIARELGVPYQIVFAATKAKKEAAAPAAPADAAAAPATPA